MAGYKFRVICFLSSFWITGCLIGGGDGKAEKDPDANTNETIEPDYSKRGVVIKNAFVFEVDDSASILRQTEFIPECTDTGLSYQPLNYDQYAHVNKGVMSLWSENSCNAWVYKGEGSEPYTGTWASINSETGPIPEGFEIPPDCDSIAPVDPFAVSDVVESYRFEGDSLFTEISAQLCELASFTDWVVFEEFNFLYDVFIDSIPDISDGLNLIWTRLSFQDINCQSYQLSLRTEKARVTNYYKLNSENEVIGEHYEFEYNNLSCETDISYLEPLNCEAGDPWSEFLACVFLTDFFPLESALEESGNRGL